jgi:ATP-dependent RNA helicase DeaD
MSLTDHAELLGPDLFGAIERKGYADLTAVQRAVLDPALTGRDLRITSQTGSGKTLAIGLSLRGIVSQDAPARQGVAAPRALIVAPTRELAHQVEQELSWLYAESKVRLATTTGGASYRDEHRALSRGPAIVVGTPGRLLDHLDRGSIDPAQVEVVVLDEADRMLDLGFREDLEKLFEKVPKERTTHLVSATFPRMVRAFADRLQREPAHVEGTRLGAANADIDHVIHVVAPDQRLDALINLLLANPQDQTLVFVRTRADAAHIANELVVTGFAASALSGEMEQSARNRTLAAFKQGGLRVLIATDVAARGIDVQDVSRVVHGELPTNPDAYTHRAGRTGRAGRKGISSLLVPPIGVVRATRLLRGLGVQHRFEPIPSAAEILRADDERLFAELTRGAGAEDARSGEDADSTEAAEVSGVHERAAQDKGAERWSGLVQRLLESGEVERTLTRLLLRAHRGVTMPRNVRAFPERTRREDPRDAKRDKRRGRDEDFEDRPVRDRPKSRKPAGADEPRAFDKRTRDAGSEAHRNAEPAARGAERDSVRDSKRHNGRDAQRDTTRDTEQAARRAEYNAGDAEQAGRDTKRGADRVTESDTKRGTGRRGDARESAPELPRSPYSRDSDHPRAPRRPGKSAEAPAFTSFHVSWGERSGADARRLLAMICRRGQIRGHEVGAIRVEPTYSLVEVSTAVAPSFARAASRPDPREPDVIIRIDRAKPPDELAATQAKLRPKPFERRPPSKRDVGGRRPPKRHSPKARSR